MQNSTNTTQTDTIIACSHCDHICHVPKLAKHEVAYCPVCEHRISKAVLEDLPQRIMAFASSAILLLLLSLAFDFMTFTSSGVTKTIALTDAALVMFAYDYPLLALLINLCILVIPAFLLSVLLILYSPLQHTLPSAFRRMGITLILLFRDWCMAEIFLISVIVSMVKLVSMAQIDLGLSFYAFTGFTVMLLITFWHIDYSHLWQRISPSNHDQRATVNSAAIEQQLSVCSRCGQIASQSHCQRCHAPLRLRDPYALQKTCAWIVTAILFYIPANLYPIMTTVIVGDSQPSNIISGILLLWKDQSYAVASIIFIASIVVPLLKLLVMCCLCVVAYFNLAFSQHAFTRLYTIVEYVGKWSMIDVFVVVILVALIQLGGILQIYPGPGALFFACMVFASMMATTCFDPRLLWDKSYQTKRPAIPSSTLQKQ